MTNNSINNKVGNPTNTNFFEVEKSASGLMINMDDQTDVFGYYNNAGSPQGVVAANIGSVCTDTTNGNLYMKTTDTVNTGWALISLSSSGSLVKSAQATTSTKATTTVAIPFDNTIPQNTEGTSFLTLAYTPLSATNNLRIEVYGWGLPESGTEALLMSICDTGIANALVAGVASYSGVTAQFCNVYMSVTVVAGSTAARTYDWRFGNSTGAGNVSLQGTSTTAYFSTAGLATIRVTEYLP